MKPTITHRLRMTADVKQALCAFHLAEGKRVEAISIALGHATADDQGQTLALLSDPDRVLAFAPDCLKAQGSHHVTLDKEVAAAVNYLAVSQGYTAIVIVHDHWFARHASFSPVDDYSDLADANNYACAIAPQTPAGMPLVVVSMVIAKDDWGARLLHPLSVAGEMPPVRVDVVGEHDFRPSAGAVEVLPARLARQIGVLGERAQRRIRELRFAVVGCGGTGAPTAEALVRSGARSLLLCDPDRVEASNLNRLQGAGEDDIGRLKVEVVAQHLRRQFPGVAVDTVADAVHSHSGQAALAGADIVFGCVDDNATRYWLNRHVVAHLQPWIDIGVAISVRPRPIFHWRVTTIIPGTTPCGHCSPICFYDRAKPQAFADALERGVRRQAGYIDEAGRDGDGDPSVYALNLIAVAQAQLNLLRYLGDEPAAHSIYHRSDRESLERLPLAGLRRPGDGACPVCDMVLGTCRAHTPPGSGSREAPGQDLIEVLNELEKQDDASTP